MKGWVIYNSSKINYYCRVSKNHKDGLQSIFIDYTIIIYVKNHSVTLFDVFLNCYHRINTLYSMQAQLMLSTQLIVLEFCYKFSSVDLDAYYPNEHRLQNRLFMIKFSIMLYFLDYLNAHQVKHHLSFLVEVSILIECQPAQQKQNIVLVLLYNNSSLFKFVVSFGQAVSTI